MLLFQLKFDERLCSGQLSPWPLSCTTLICWHLMSGSKIHRSLTACDVVYSTPRCSCQLLLSVAAPRRRDLLVQIKMAFCLSCPTPTQTSPVNVKVLWRAKLAPQRRDFSCNTSNFGVSLLSSFFHTSVLQWLVASLIRI